MVVKHVTDSNDFNEAKKSGKLVVADFFATWCGPCKRIAPKIEEFSTKYPNAIFLKIDVDELSELAAEVGVQAMPTFKLFLSNKEVGELVGANEVELENLIKKHYN